MAISKTPVAGGYFAERDFINIKTSLIISIFEYFESLFFEGENGRVIYASDSFAFRRRNQLLNKDEANHPLLAQNLNLPFANFYITGISSNTDRNWKSRPLELSGIMDWSVNKKLRLSPVQISFEATIYTEKETDKNYVTSQIIWEDILETKLKPLFEIEGEIFSNIALVGYTGNFTDQYQESDWLEKNKIRATSFDFTVDTYLVRTNSLGFCIPKTVLASFTSSQDIKTFDPENYDELLNGVIDHINGKTVFD